MWVKRSAARRGSTRFCRWGNLGGGYVVGAALPLGFPPVCAAQGHGGKRLVTGPRPLSGSVDVHRHRAKWIERTAYPRGRTASPSVVFPRRTWALSYLRHFHDAAAWCRAFKRGAAPRPQPVSFIRQASIVASTCLVHGAGQRGAVQKRGGDTLAGAVFTVGHGLTGPPY